MSIVDYFQKSLDHTIPPPINMPKCLRNNAIGLEATYGRVQFVERIRAAADIIEELETALMLIVLNSNQPIIKDIAEEALIQFDRMRK